MPLETGTYVQDLVGSNPPGTDPASQGDDHLRLIKTVLKNTFPSATVAMPKATTPQAVAGTDDAAFMTPLKTAQAIAALGGGGGGFPGSTVQDHGVTQGPGSNVLTFDFEGTGVTAAVVGSTATITVNAGSITVQDEGIPQGPATTFNFVGAGVTAGVSGGVATVTIPSPPGGGINGITVQDEGITQGTPLSIQTLNFVGPGVVASAAGSTGTITIGAGGSISVRDHAGAPVAGITTLNIGGDLTLTIAGSLATISALVNRPYFIGRFNSSGSQISNLGQGSGALGGVTHSSTGVYSMTFSGSATPLGVCQVTGGGSTSSFGFVQVTSLTPTTLAITVRLVDDTGAAVDREFNLTIW